MQFKQHRSLSPAVTMLFVMVSIAVQRPLSAENRSVSKRLTSVCQTRYYSLLVLTVVLAGMFS